MPELSQAVGYKLAPQVFKPIDPSYVHMQLPERPVVPMGPLYKAEAFSAIAKALSDLPENLQTEYQKGRQRGLQNAVQNKYTAALKNYDPNNPASVDALSQFTYDPGKGVGIDSSKSAEIKLKRAQQTLDEEKAYRLRHQYDGVPMDDSTAPTPSPSAGGAPSADLGGDGWETGYASSFGGNDPVEYANNGHFGSPVFGKVDLRDPEGRGVAVPQDILQKYLGNNPANWTGAQAEVVNHDTGQRQIVPIKDVGPGPTNRSKGAVVDLLPGTAKDVGGNGWSKSSVRIIPASKSADDSTPDDTTQVAAATPDASAPVADDGSGDAQQPGTPNLAQFVPPEQADKISQAAQYAGQMLTQLSPEDLSASTNSGTVANIPPAPQGTAQDGQFTLAPGPAPAPFSQGEGAAPFGATVPGGEFNPNAEVRRAIPVDQGATLANFDTSTPPQAVTGIPVTGNNQAGTAPSNVSDATKGSIQNGKKTGYFRRPGGMMAFYENGIMTHLGTPKASGDMSWQKLSGKPTGFTNAKDAIADVVNQGLTPTGKFQRTQDGGWVSEATITPKLSKSEENAANEAGVYLQPGEMLEAFRQRVNDAIEQKGRIPDYAKHEWDQFFKDVSTDPHVKALITAQHAQEALSSALEQAVNGKLPQAAAASAIDAYTRSITGGKPSKMSVGMVEHGPFLQQLELMRQKFAEGPNSNTILTPDAAKTITAITDSQLKKAQARVDTKMKNDIELYVPQGIQEKLIRGRYKSVIANPPPDEVATNSTAPAGAAITPAVIQQSKDATLQKYQAGGYDSDPNKKAAVGARLRAAKLLK